MSKNIYIQSHRKSIVGYNSMLADRDIKVAHEANVLEEDTRLNKEIMANASQEKINEICNDVQLNYDAMILDGRNMEKSQHELNQKIKEDDMFQKTKTENYPLLPLDESSRMKMHLRKAAYHLLPIADCIFAFLALAPIFTSKLAQQSAVLANFAEVIGAIVSIALGYLLSIFSRVGTASLDEKDSHSMRVFKRIGVICSMLLLPLMYIVGEAHFNGGTSWIYSVIFAFVSFVIQFLIVTGYHSHIAAIEYCETEKMNNETTAIMVADEQAIKEEEDAIQNKMQRITDSFNNHYSLFTQRFRDLAAAREEHIRSFEQGTKIYLNQLVIYIGNLVCFRREVIPLFYEQDGTVSSVPFVDFPYISGGRRVLASDDFVILDYMLRQGQYDITLSETIKEISRHHPQESSLPVSQTTPATVDENYGDGDSRGEDEVIW